MNESDSLNFVMYKLKIKSFHKNKLAHGGYFIFQREIYHIHNRSNNDINNNILRRFCYVKSLSNKIISQLRKQYYFFFFFFNFEKLIFTIKLVNII